MSHNINWNASAYAGRNFNDIIFIGGNRVGTGYFRNVGNTQRMGTELGLNGKLGNKWSWYGNYSYVRASFETSQNISSPDTLLIHMMQMVQVLMVPLVQGYSCKADKKQLRLPKDIKLESALVMQYLHFTSCYKNWYWLLLHRKF